MNNTKKNGTKKTNKQYTITKSESAIFMKLTMPEKEEIYIQQTTQMNI